MKIISVMLLIAGLLAIAGAAFVQLFVFSAISLFGQQAYSRHTTRLN